MIARSIHTHVEAALALNRVAGLAGVRGGGKATLVESLAASFGEPADGPLVFLHLERAEDAAKVSDAEQYLRGIGARLVVLGEIDRRPDLLPLIWRLIDGRRYRGNFLLTTSVMPAWMAGNAGADSAALIEDLRRTAWFQLSALTIGEVPVDVHETLWLRGGLPGSLFAESDNASLAWRRRWLDDLLERRMTRLAGRVSPDSMRRMLGMLARVQGEVWNASRIARGLGVSVPTVKRWLKVLQALFLVREVPSIDIDTGKRLIKAPRLYLRDVGLVNLLLGTRTRVDLLDSPWVAAGWEGWMLEQFIERLPAECGLGHYRTRSGGNVDLVVVGADGTIERIVDFRYGGGGSRGFTLATADLGVGEQQASVITAGSGLRGMLQAGRFPGKL